MNVFLRIGRWWELRKPVRQGEFQERMAMVDASAKAAIKTNQTVMSRFADEQSVKAQLAELRRRVDKLEGIIVP